MARPRIGITVDWDDAGRTVTQRVDSEGAYFLYAGYANAVRAAGGVPLLIPNVTTGEAAEAAIGAVAGIVITGGDFDIDPATYGADPSPQLGAVIAERTNSERALLEAALEARIPVLAICGGEQLLNVVTGGTLVQDIPSEVDGALEHEQDAPKTETTHSVEVTAGTILATAMGGLSAQVNSTHHQAVKDVGTGLCVNAVAPDGVIEGVELEGHPFAVGVQWHPEILAATDEAHANLFRAFVAACR